MKHLKSIAMAASLFLAPTMATSALAQSTSMFILDASGSMWGRLPDKQMKIVAARDAMGELLGALPENISAGLIAYGHRKKGDCGDIEVVQEAVPGGGAKIAARIGSLQPRGKTPISDSLQLAGEKLTGIEDPTTIVLVSDGIETCEGDPCAVAESLAQSQANLNIHVIGYAVDLKTKTQLQCVAEKGRGEYFTADNLGDLKTALATVTESIKSAEPIKVAVPEVEAPKVDDNSTTITIQIAGPGTIKLKLADWVTEPKYWKILDPETGEEVVKTSDDEISTMAGDYQLAWRHVEHGAHEVNLPEIITVNSGEVTEAVIDTGIQLVPPAETDRPYYWQLIPAGSKIKKTFRSRDATAWYSVWDAVPVPAGSYTLLMRQSEHDHTEANLGTVELDGGSLTQYPLDQGVNVQWNDAWGEKVYDIIFTGTDGNTTKTDTEGPLFLAPGDYDVALRLTEHGHREAQFGKVTVAETGFTDPKLTSGITFETKIEGKFSIIAKNLDTGSEAKMTNRWGPMPLGAGRYQFDLKMEGNKAQTIVPELEIKPGQFITAKM